MTLFYRTFRIFIFLFSLTLFFSCRKRPLSLEDLDPASQEDVVVGVNTGWFSDYVYERMGRPCYRFDSTSDAILALKNKTIDAYYLDNDLAIEVMEQVDGLAILKKGMTQDDVAVLCPAFRPDIVQQWEDFIPKLRENDLWKKMQHSYFYDFYDPEIFAQTSPLTSGPLIKVGYQADNFPYSYVKADSDRPYGYGIEIVYLFAREYGYQVEFVEGNWDTNILDVKENRVDFSVNYYSQLYKDDIESIGKVVLTSTVISYNVVYLIREQE